MKKKKFRITYIENSKSLKESLYTPRLPRVKAINICLVLIVALIGIQALITGKFDNFYKVSDLFLIWAFFPTIFYALNKSSDLKEVEQQAKKTYEIIETIDEKELHKNYPTLNIEESFPLDSFQIIVKTKNMYHIYMEDDKREGWTTIYRHNIEGGSEDELINFLFSKCKNIKKKKVVGIWIEQICIIFALIILVINIAMFVDDFIGMIKSMFQI